MNKSAITKSILHQFGIGQAYKGYDFILCSLDLISQDDSFLKCVTKVLYADVAHKYQTSSPCVERDIRKVIEIIWKSKEENKVLIKQIFGTKYLHAKPSNTEFLELLSQYIKLEEGLHDLNCFFTPICPISKQECAVCQELFQDFIKTL